MNRYVATFHTHLSAMRTSRALSAAGVAAALAPVPRRLSASCGTCVRYEAASPMRDCMDRDFESIAEIAGEDTYKTLFVNA